jgi:hypothetical protein
MAGNSGAGTGAGAGAGGASSSAVAAAGGGAGPEATAALPLDAAMERLFADNVDAEFEKYFLGMYFYFVSWRNFVRRVRRAYSAAPDSPEGLARRGRLMNVLSMWLEMNAHLRQIVQDDGPKKKKPAAAAPAAAAAAAIAATESGPAEQPPNASSSPGSVSPRSSAASPKSSPRSPGPRKSGTPRKALPRPPAELETEPRVPCAADADIVVLCGELQACVVALQVALLAHSDQDALKETRRLTETSLKLIELVQETKEETEPEFLDQGQLLRGNIVSLTQGIVAVIKVSWIACRFLAILALMSPKGLVQHCGAHVGAGAHRGGGRHVRALCGNGDSGDARSGGGAAGRGRVAGRGVGRGLAAREREHRHH